MRIATIPQPLRVNYGGLLQAYALQVALERLGHQVSVIDLPEAPYRLSFTALAKRLIKKYILGKDIFVLHEKKWAQTADRRSANTQRFIDKYIHRRQLADCSELSADEYEVFVVGSDQVWRPMYNYKIEDCFLQFAERWENVRRISYAASFGTSQWEYTPEQTQTCARLAQKFDAILVWEDSGMTLCSEYLAVSVTHVPDPTHLLAADDYIRLVEEANEPQHQGQLFCYVLDETDSIKSLVNQVEKQTGFKAFTTMPDPFAPRNFRSTGCVYPTVTAWIRSFMDAEFVLTDSFHGCVFSILFNKPFIVFGNASRGQARFQSLLKMFGLEKRLYSGTGDFDKLLKEPIDWESVNNVRNEWVAKGKEFLVNNL